MNEKNPIGAKPEEKGTNIKHAYKFDKVISAVRKTGVPLNRTSIRTYAVEYMIRDFTDDETGFIKIGELSNEIRELRGVTKTVEIEDIKLY